MGVAYGCARVEDHPVRPLLNIAITFSFSVAIGRERPRQRVAVADQFCIEPSPLSIARSAPPSWPETLTLRWKAGVGDGYGTPLVVGRDGVRVSRGAMRTRCSPRSTPTPDAGSGRCLRATGFSYLAHRRGAVTRAAVRRHRGDHGNPRPHVSDRHTDRARSTACIRRGAVGVIGARHRGDVARCCRAPQRRRRENCLPSARPLSARRLHRCLDRSGERRLCGAADEPSTRLQRQRVRVRRGMFFIGYALFEVPSNLLLMRVGARAGIARIMITLGLLVDRDAVRRTARRVLRAALPARRRGSGLPARHHLYLGNWYPSSDARAPCRGSCSGFRCRPRSAVRWRAAILGLNGWPGSTAWQWLFLLEGIPAVVGVVVLFYLRDRPADSRWLSPEQRAADDSGAGTRLKPGDAQ